MSEDLQPMTPTEQAEYWKAAYGNLLEERNKLREERDMYRQTVRNLSDAHQKSLKTAR